MAEFKDYLGNRLSGSSDSQLSESDVQELLALKDRVDSLSSVASPYVVTSCGVGGIRKMASSLATDLALDEYPYTNKYGDRIVFKGVISDVETFNVAIGKGKFSANGFGDYQNAWIEIDKTNVYAVITPYVNGVATPTKSDAIPHGLVIDQFISIFLEYDDSNKMHIVVFSRTNSNQKGHFETTIDYKTTFSKDGIEPRGRIKAVNIGSGVSNCILSCNNTHLRNSLWVFGASYENPQGWTQYAMSYGVKNILVNAYSGRDSKTCWEDFARASRFGMPKYLYWTMWGNGSAADLDTYIGKVKDYCDANGVTLIIISRPNSKATDVQQTYEARKAVIDKYIAMGVRYVDAAFALSSDYDNPDGWYASFANSDGKHPTARGYESLAMQVMLDIPEIMQFA